jgi:hypothetical protein
MRQQRQLSFPPPTLNTQLHSLEEEGDEMENGEDAREMRANSLIGF